MGFPDGNFFCLSPAAACVVNASGYYHTWFSVRELVVVVLSQFAEMAQRERRIDLEAGEKLFILISALWGSVQVVCGYLLLLLAVTNSWGDYPFLSNSALALALCPTTSLISITSGKCTIASTCFPGNGFLRLFVLITSIISCIFAVCQFLLLVTSEEKHTHCEEVIKSVTLFALMMVAIATIINAIFLFFLFKRSQSRPEVEEPEYDINDAPPPYEVAVQNNSDQEGFGETRSSPICRIHNGSFLAQADLNSSYI